MKGTAIFLAIALISTIAYSGIIVDQSGPVLTTTTIKPAGKTTVTVQNPVVFQYGTILVPKQLWFVGLHGVAYKQLTYLYPSYKNWNVKACSYTVYGPSRIYAFDLWGPTSETIRVFSSVQNNEEASGEQTQETVEQQAKAELNAKEANKQQQISNENSGYYVIKLSRAYEIPRVAVAIKEVTRANWRDIRSAPLVRCLEKWELGVYTFRLFFDGVPRWFEYQRSAAFVSKDDEVETPKSNLRAEVVADFYEKQISNEDKTEKPVATPAPAAAAPATAAPATTPKVAKDEGYLPRQQPIFSVKTVDGYQLYTLETFRRHPGYKTVVAGLTNHFGRFEDVWINAIQYRVDVDVHYFQIQVQFIPFLCDVDLEAHYYGSSEKAAILQIDERVFNPNDHGKYVDKWSEIKEFNSYKVFREANEYVLSQFTYLRFYKVTAAYSALHKNGRYVRLVYQSQNHFFTPNGENQFNMLVYLCNGKFYIEREDFLATNTESRGRVGWLALFVNIDKFDQNAAYKNIAKYFGSRWPVFWSEHKVEEVKVKDDVYVVKFYNPKIAVAKICAVNVTKDDVKVLNHFNWTVVDENSLHHSKSVEYVREKHPGSTPLWVHSLVSPYGRHFEVSYLDEKKVFGKTFLRYVDAEDLVTDDEWQGIAYEIDFDEIPVPANVEEHLIQWLADHDDSVVSIVDVKNVKRNAYQCLVLTEADRWTVTLNWVKGQWVINNKELINDGYFFVSGYPSVAVASTTGFLARLYPTSFNSQWVYSAIEVKNIGYFVYNRVIYRLGNVAYQGIVRTTHGVENSHSLISWDKVRFLREKRDYGYGIHYDWSYGLGSRYFFDYVPTVQVEAKVEVTVEVVDKTDLLCTYWDGDNCLSCAGDYYADNNGRCVRIEDECEYWKVSGVCSRCSLGWIVDGKGKCVAKSH